MAGQPGRQICPICALDDEVTTVKVDGEWVMSCANEAHPPYEWRPAAQYTRAQTYRTGVGEELGVYTTLLDCVIDGLAEYGVVEHRFAERDPATYRVLIERYGHTSLEPRRYTTSAFLGGALGQLWREGLITGTWGPATGFWKYNGRVGTYGPAGTPEDAPILSWQKFACDTLGVDPDSWPATGSTEVEG